MYKRAPQVVIAVVTREGAIKLPLVVREAVDADVVQGEAERQIAAVGVTAPARAGRYDVGVVITRWKETRK